MSKTILVTGNHYSIGRALTEHFLGKGYSVLSCGSTSTDPLQKQETGGRYKYLRWNENSPIAAKNLVLSAVNTFNELNDAFLFYQPEIDNRAFHELPTSAVSGSVDNAVKGYLYLAKELTRYFMGRKKGSLSIILYTGGHGLLPPINSALLGALRASGEALISFYQNEPIKILGFESSSPEKEAFLSYIIKIWEEKDKHRKGRWNQYTEKSGLFQSLSLSSFKNRGTT